MVGESRPPEEVGAEEALAEEADLELEDSSIPEDAFFSPDDPIADSEGEIPEDAIFSPDDPLIQSEAGEGVVTGMGGWAAGPPPDGRGIEWEIRRTADLLKSLERNLREHGMEALRVHPEVEPMDAMLRSFIAGYLVGSMEGED